MTLKGKDTLSLVNYQNKLTVFSRSVTKSSHLYWSQQVNGNWSDWALIGGSSVSLNSDEAIAYNGFSKVWKSVWVYSTECIVMQVISNNAWISLIY